MSHTTTRGFRLAGSTVVAFSLLIILRLTNCSVYYISQFPTTVLPTLYSYTSFKG